MLTISRLGSIHTDKADEYKKNPQECVVQRASIFLANRDSGDCRVITLCFSRICF